MKKVLLSILILFTIVFANGFYYVFHGQFKSAEKLAAGKELNAYECFSIYTMHTALWMFFWPASPAAANEVFMKQFCSSSLKEKEHTNPFFKKSILSDRVLKTMRSLRPGESKYISWNGNISYALTDPEHKAAMTINPCTISREKDPKTGKEYFFIRLDNSWPKRSHTHIILYKSLEIEVEEGLFRYLQDKGIIHNFVDIYRYPVDMITKI